MSAIKWIPSVGLEIHAQILSTSKLFSDGPTKIQDKQPNTAVDLFDIALPGTMPVLNVSCVKAGILTALAVGARVNMVSFFDRKHYFYPDLPAGYQITQKRVPLAVGGSLSLPVQNMQQLLNVRFKQLQLEQDSGKITYGEPTSSNGGKETLIDYNRAGVALMEMVTEPDLKNGTEAAAFVKELRHILLAIDTCDGNIQDGSMRVDANVSVRRSDSSSLGIRTEIKNVSGFRLLTKAVDYEIARQIKVLENGGEIEQETRRFDERKGITIATRRKTKLQDYCFMAEHDLPPIVLYSNSSPPSQTAILDEHIINIDQVLELMPELPSQLRTRLCSQYGLSTQQVQVLMGRDNASCYFEEVLQHCSQSHSVHSWITSELYGLLDNMNIELKDSPISPKQLASIVVEITNNALTGQQGKKMLKQMANGDKRLAQVIVASDIQTLTQEQIQMTCIKVLQLFPEQVGDYLSGKEKVLGFLVGQVMKELEGNGDPKTVKLTLKTEISNLDT